MNTAIWVAVLGSQIFLVGGQIFVKQAMLRTHQMSPWSRPVMLPLVCGIAALSGWFLLWGGLLQKRDLSFIYPFEGLSPVLIVFAAGWFLNEKIGTRSWLGIALIGAGVAVVATS